MEAYSPIRLDRKMAKLVHVNLRKEIHGEARVLAGDLNFEFADENDILSEFDPELKAALYRAPENDEQLELDPNFLPVPRFAKLGALKWDYALIGAEVILHTGISEKSDIKFILSKVNKFSFDCKEGGRVITRFRVQSQLEPKQVAKLAELIEENVEVTIIPPEEEPGFTDD